MVDKGDAFFYDQDGFCTNIYCNTKFQNVSRYTHNMDQVLFFFLLLFFPQRMVKHIRGINFVSPNVSFFLEFFQALHYDLFRCFHFEEYLRASAFNAKREEGEIEK